MVACHGCCNFGAASGAARYVVELDNHRIGKPIPQ
jgi:hypothetical protein